jgi:predicted DNA-binding transcriptional regulator YafY
MWRRRKDAMASTERAIRLVDMIERVRRGCPLLPDVLAEEYGISVRQVYYDLLALQLPPLNVPLLRGYVVVPPGCDKPHN